MFVARPVHDARAFTACRFILENITYRFGVPETIISDHDPTFTTAAWLTFMARLRINTLCPDVSLPGRSVGPGMSHVRHEGYHNGSFYFLRFFSLALFPIFEPSFYFSLPKVIRHFSFILCLSRVRHFIPRIHVFPEFAIGPPHIRHKSPLFRTPCPRGTGWYKRMYSPVFGVIRILVCIRFFCLAFSFLFQCKLNAEENFVFF